MLIEGDMEALKKVLEELLISCSHRPSTFDHLQYTKMEGEGLGNLTM